MMRATPYLFALVTMMGLGACASAGKKFDYSRVDAIKVGVQDKNTIAEWFGTPYMQTKLGDNPKGCRDRWTYTYARAVGFGTVTESQTLVVDFDANDKVCDQGFSRIM